MQQKGFLSIQGAAKRLAELGRPLSADRLRGLLGSSQLPCAVYWLTRYCWLYVDPRGAAHHEKHGWPEWAAGNPEDVSPSPDNPDPPLIYFTDEADHPNLNDRIGRPLQGGPGGLNLADFQPGLFIPVAAIEALVVTEERLGKLQADTSPRPLQRGRALQIEIISAINALGYDPKALPVSPPGKGGVRKQVRDYLETGNTKLTESTFRKACQKLRENGEIQDA